MDNNFEDRFGYDFPPVADPPDAYVDRLAMRVTTILFVGAGVAVALGFVALGIWAVRAAL